MFFKNNKKEEFVEEKKKEMTGIEIIKKELTCPVYKINYLDNPDISFGYEVNYIDDIDIIPVFISYQGYKIRIEHYKKDFDNTYWLHLYINKNHYEKNKTEILNTLNQIKSNIKDNDFKSEIIPEIFPIIINNYILSCQKKLKYSLWIKGYFHIFLLFKKLCLDYEKDYLAYLNHQLNLIAKNNYDANESIIPKIQNLFILLFLSTRNTHTEIMKKMWRCLFEEILIREIYLLFQDDEYKDKSQNLIFKIRKEKIYLYLFENNPYFKIRYIDDFIRDCKTYNNI